MRVVIGILGIAIAVAGLKAQGSSSDTFEAVAIKPHDRNLQYTSTGRDGSEWTATNANLLLLLKNAFPQFGDDGRLVGLTGWMVEQRFDVRAKSNAPITYPAATTLIRNMVIERFAVRTHMESRLLDVYVARLASPGTLGQWLAPTAPDCVEAREKKQAPPASCDRMVRERERTGVRALTLLASPFPVLLATYRQVGGFDRPLIDRTGLPGLYDASIAYQAADPLNARDGATNLPTAVRDQLGVIFEPGREQVDVLVIDSASPPSLD